MTEDGKGSSTLMVVLLLTGLFTGLLIPVSADLEPINNDLNTTEIIAPGVAMAGALNSSDNDHYKFSVVSAQNISAKLVFDSGTGTIYGDLFGPDKTRIGGTGSFAVGLTYWYNFTTSTATAGDYYFKVASSSNAFYNLTVTMSMQNDAGSGLDAGDADINPYPVTSGTYKGYIGNDDDNDFYNFVVTEAQVMTINFTTGTVKTSDLYIDLFSPIKSRITGTGDVNPGVSKGFNYTTSLLGGGTYYLKVSGGDNDYTFSVILTNQNDFGLGLDAADTDVSPTLITPDVTGDGWIANLDTMDLYGFTVDSGKKVVLTFTTGTVRSDDLYVDLYNPAKYRLTGTGDVNSGITKTISYTTSSSQPGIYYVVVSGGANAYTLRVNLVSQTDGGSTGDAPDNFPGLTVTGCSPCGGWISNDDTKDYYAVNLTNGQIVTLNLTVGSYTTSDLYIDIYDPLQSRLTGTGDVNAGVTGSIRYTSSFETPGLYLFLVSGGSNEYNVTMDIEDQDDAGTGMDAPEAFDDAVMLDTGSYEGWQEDADSVDTFNVTVMKGNVFTVNLTTGTGGALSMTATVYDATRTAIKSIMSAPGMESTWTLEDGKKPLADSTYYIKVFYGAGNHYTLDIDLPYIPPDITPPVISISSPSSGALTNAGTATIIGTASDDSGTVALVESSLNSGPYIPCVGTVNWTATVLLNDGSNTIMVRVKDAAGNEVSQTVTITFDGEPPSMNLTAPATRTVKGTAATIAGTATDNMGVGSVEVMVNGGNWTSATGTTNWTVAVTLVKGPNTILVRVTDTAGNEAQVSYTITSEKETSDKKSGSPGFEGAVLFCAIVVGLAILARRRN